MGVILAVSGGILTNRALAAVKSVGGILSRFKLGFISPAGIFGVCDLLHQRRLRLCVRLL